MRLLVHGAGAGGFAAAVELTLAGHDVTLSGRSAATLRPVQDDGIRYDGVLGSGVLQPSRVTNDLRNAIEGVEAAIVVLPTTAHVEAAVSLAAAGWGKDRPVILNPGHLGGALEFATAYRRNGHKAPPIAEFSTLPYVARKSAPNHVAITGRANRLRAAALPGASAARDLACALFPGGFPVADVLASGLASVNMVLHTPGSVLASAWVEARDGDFLFYIDAMTAGVARVIQALDRERLAVARAFGHDLPNLIAEMKLLGTVEADAPEHDFRAAISGGRANSRIKAPDSFSHRYYGEDFGHGLAPLVAVAGIAGVDTPVARGLASIGMAMLGAGTRPRRDLASMGLAGCTFDQLLTSVRA